MYHLFERFGIELEYMIVDRDTRKVLPIADKILAEINGEITNEVIVGDIAWSNELALHVIELKSAAPVSSLFGYDKLFHESIQRINGILGKYNACLMGGAMHPFMDPISEMRLWPHDYNPIYNAFDKIFSCKGHGWANLQSMHINLPFANDEEFGRLHTAIRLVLPLIPALSAGSPIVDGKISGFYDTRMEVYRLNSIRIPSITGLVIPEAVFSREQYQKDILQPIYKDLAPYDPEKILQEEWVNARGAIARFERNTIEIRVIDVQETPFSDLAIAGVIIECIKALVEENFSSFDMQKDIPTELLAKIFLDSIKSGEGAVLHNSDYLKAMGFKTGSYAASEIWKKTVTRLEKRNKSTLNVNSPSLETIFKEGTLANRMLQFSGSKPEFSRVKQMCDALCVSLESGTMF